VRVFVLLFAFKGSLTNERRLLSRKHAVELLIVAMASFLLIVVLGFLLMSVIRLLKARDDLVVLFCALFGSDRGHWVLKVDKVLGSHDGLEPVSNHNDRHRLTLLFLNVRDCFLNFVFRLGVEG